MADKNFCKKCNKVKEDLIIQCSGMCRNTFHLTCIKMGKRDFNLLTSNQKHVKWFCQDCIEVLFDKDGFFRPSTTRKTPRSPTNRTCSPSKEFVDSKIFKEVLTRMDSLTQELQTLKMDVTSIKNKKVTLNTKTLHNIHYIQQTQSSIKTRSKSMSECLSNKNEDDITFSIDRLKPAEHNNKQTPTSFAIIASPSTHATPPTVMIDKNQTNKVQAPSPKVEKPPSRRNYGIAGIANTNNPFQAAPRKSWLHIWNANISTSKDDITKFVKNIITSEDIICDKLISKGAYASFKVGVEETQLLTLLNPEIWPEGIYVKRFFHQRRKVNQTT